MTIKEIRKNLFKVDKEYYLAHCISTDCNMGAGIAVDFQKKFKLKSKLLVIPEENRKHPTCILVGRVFNLITKNVYHGKPTYKTMELALLKMKEIAIANDIKKIAMYKIGCNSDLLSWGKVREIVNEVFKDTDIDILVCSK